MGRLSPSSDRSTHPSSPALVLIMEMISFSISLISGMLLTPFAASADFLRPSALSGISAPSGAAFLAEDDEASDAFSSDAFPCWTAAAPPVPSLYRISRNLKLSQADTRAFGVFLSPIPKTVMPDSRSRMTSFVKSLSEVTMQKPSTFPEYKMSIASMISAESDAFFPCV